MANRTDPRSFLCPFRFHFPSYPVLMVSLFPFVLWNVCVSACLCLCRCVCVCLCLCLCVCWGNVLHVVPACWTISHLTSKQDSVSLCTTPPPGSAPRHFNGCRCFWCFCGETSIAVVYSWSCSENAGTYSCHVHKVHHACIHEHPLSICGSVPCLLVCLFKMYQER